MDDSFVYQQKGVKEIEQNLNKDFFNVSDWFVDNKLNIHFADDKTKSMLFGKKDELNKVCSVGIRYVAV